MMATTNSYGQEMLEKYQKYKKMVAKAVEDGKVFRIVGRYDWPRLRIELRRRGWVEKQHFTSDSDMTHFPQSILLEEAKPGNEYERALIARMLGGVEPEFIWMTSGKYYSRHLNTPILNKIYVRFCNFGGKDGLLKYFESIGDFAYHPRSYNVIGGMNLEQFEEDFLLTASISVILYLDNHQSLAEKFSKKPTAIKWTLMLKLLNFVQFHIENHAYGMKIIHENGKNSGLNQDHADLILALYDDVCKGQKDIELYHRNAQDHIPVIRSLAQRIRETWPKRLHDGYENIWLLKPAYSGQGNGIILSSDVRKITKIVKEERERYIVQKYIERPLLIHGTKFDIRQYFLITIHKEKIRGWVHSKCTNRFASKEFDLRNLSRVAHITNTSVQRRYKNKANPKLPECHMWRVRDLMEYFWSIGKPHAWNEIIFPSIKSTLVAFMKACVHNIELRPGRFEIFGCDWLITEDLKTYLLEINRSPSLYYYTAVSVDVVGTVMNDLIKVTVDYMKDETASTGGFELIHELDFGDLPFEPFAMDWAAYNINCFRRPSSKDDDDLVSEPDVKGSLETLIDENIPQKPMPPRQPPIPPPPPPPPQRSPVLQHSDALQTSINENVAMTEETKTEETTAEKHKNVLMETTKANVIASPSLEQMPAAEKQQRAVTPCEKTIQTGGNENDTENENPESSKYIIPPACKKMHTAMIHPPDDNDHDYIGDIIPVRDGDIGLCDQNVPLPPPEVLMGQDFDPYGESLITY